MGIKNGLVAWCAAEDEIMVANYQTMGGTGILRSGLLPGRTRDAIKNRADALNLRVVRKTARGTVRRYVGGNRKKESAWGLPGMTLTESLDCDRMTRWRYSAKPAQLAARL